ncbi:MAG TPA: hypothetical protein PKA64_21040 [Myxococcota bacterium]|nr:hypothetical protein [Myxococcota bacterium]
MRGFDLAGVWGDYHASVTSEIEENGRAISALGEQRAGFVTAVAEAAGSLAAVFVPSLDAGALAEAERRTGFRGYSRFDPIKAMEREDQRLRAEIDAVRADERFQRREHLVGPYGEVTRRLEEARSMLEPWERECQAFEQLDGFAELLEVGYDTPEFSVRWWEARYWRIWATGDRICALLGMADFGDDVLPAYLKVREPRDRWRARVEEVMAEVRSLHDLVQRHDQAVTRLGGLAGIYLDECRAALARHLETADPALIESWNPDDRAVVLGVRRLAGCRAKVDLTDQLIAGVQALDAQLQRERAKAMRKSAKFSRPKNYNVDWGPSMRPSGTARLGKVGQAREKLREAAARIERYQDYERFDLQQNDPALWFAEMTGRRPSPLCSELRDWYDRNPDACVVRVGEDADEAVARAVSALGQDDLGDVS